MPEYEFLLYETLDDGQIARIMLNRPDARNAQNRGMLVELHDAVSGSAIEPCPPRRAASGPRAHPSDIGAGIPAEHQTSVTLTWKEIAFEHCSLRVFAVGARLLHIKSKRLHELSCAER